MPSADVPAPAADPEITVVAIAEDSRRAEVVAWLERECGGCHDRDDDGHYEDLDVLMASQLLQPEAAEVSLLVLWLQYGRVTGTFPHVCT